MAFSLVAYELAIYKTSIIHMASGASSRVRENCFEAKATNSAVLGGRRYGMF